MILCQPWEQVETINTGTLQFHRTNSPDNSVINNEEVIAILSSCIKMELFLVTVSDLIEGSLKISIQ